MSAWAISAAISASLGLARLARWQSASAVGDVDDPADWRRVAHDSLRLLRVWLIVGSVCFFGAFLLLEVVGPASASVRIAAEALGIVPVVGLLGATSLALFRVGDARRVSDDVLPQVVGWSLIVAGATLGGTLAAAVLRFAQA
jgi:hypothetical protein